MDSKSAWAKGPSYDLQIGSRRIQGFVGGGLVLVGDGVHGAEELVMDGERVFKMSPDGFNVAGTGGGELDIAESEEPRGQREDDEGVLDPCQVAQCRDESPEDLCQTRSVGQGSDKPAAAKDRFKGTLGDRNLPSCNRPERSHLGQHRSSCLHRREEPGYSTGCLPVHGFNG